MKFLNNSFTNEILGLKEKEECKEKDSSNDCKLNGEFDDLLAKALDGFLLVLSTDGEVVYVSENISNILGLNQVILFILYILFSKT